MRVALVLLSAILATSVCGSEIELKTSSGTETEIAPEVPSTIEKTETDLQIQNEELGLPAAVNELESIVNTPHGSQDEVTRKKKSATTFCVEIRPSTPEQKPFQVCEPASHGNRPYLEPTSFDEPAKHLIDPNQQKPAPAYTSPVKTFNIPSKPAYPSHQGYNSNNYRSGDDSKAIMRDSRTSMDNGNMDDDEDDMEDGEDDSRKRSSYGSYGGHTSYVPMVPHHGFKNHGHNGLVITCQPNLAGYAHNVPSSYNHPLPGSGYQYRSSTPRGYGSYGSYGRPYQHYKPQQLPFGAYQHPQKTLPALKPPTAYSMPTYKPPSSYQLPQHAHNNYKIPSINQYKPAASPNYEVPTYHAPSPIPSYQAPAASPSYQAPQTAPSYQANPLAPTYQAPAATPSYQPAPASNYQAPAPTPGYQAPPPPPQAYQAPQSPPSYQSPQTYPSSSFSAPSYQTAPSNYQAPPAYTPPGTYRTADETNAQKMPNDDSLVSQISGKEEHTLKRMGEIANEQLSRTKWAPEATQTKSTSSVLDAKDQQQQLTAANGNWVNDAEWQARNAESQQNHREVLPDTQRLDVDPNMMPNTQMQKNLEAHQTLTDTKRTDMAVPSMRMEIDREAVPEPDLNPEKIPGKQHIDSSREAMIPPMSSNAWEQRDAGQREAHGDIRGQSLENHV